MGMAQYLALHNYTSHTSNKSSGFLYTYPSGKYIPRLKMAVSFSVEWVGSGVKAMAVLRRLAWLLQPYCSRCYVRIVHIL